MTLRTSKLDVRKFEIQNLWFRKLSSRTLKTSKIEIRKLKLRISEYNRNSENLIKSESGGSMDSFGIWGESVGHTWGEPFGAGYRAPPL